MYQDRIQTWHLERTAMIYLRQSSLTQIKNNLEGAERQRRMYDHVQKLGWPPSQIQMLGGDTGRSGSSLHGRDDYRIIVEAVMNQTAGLVAARELSRLARENQDWSQLVRLCRYTNVLLCDDKRVYDAADPQDRVQLGIQGAFYEFELAMIIDRMEECRRQKAERGELYEGFPPGYTCRHAHVQEKHPDARVQRAISEVFSQFDPLPSVYALHRHLMKEGFQLPLIVNSNDWRDVQWTTPSYDQLLGMLQNPSYAGIYVRGRKKVFTELDEEGNAVKRVRRVPREQWEFYIEDHHEPYISKSKWEANLQKIESNAHGKGSTHPRSPGHGSSLLAGLLRCRRCGHRLHVSYSKGMRYGCRGGKLQRDSEPQRCYSFSGSRVDRYVSDQLLSVVRPAGIEAAELAAQQMAEGRARSRQMIVDQLEACREAESRAAREYKATDQTYLTVRSKLAAEWDAALQALHAQQHRLEEFDSQTPTHATDMERQQLLTLGADLERIWFAAETDMVLKKQIVRTLIEEIMVDVDEDDDEIVLWIHWSGGHHTELRVPRLGPRRRMAETNLKEVIATLRKVMSDESMSCVLNREGITTLQGKSWTKARVSSFRRQHKIPAYSFDEKRSTGWLTQAEAATRLKISPMSVSRMVHEGILPAEQSRAGLPSVIHEPNLHRSEVQTAVHQLKNQKQRPLPADPNQLSLFK